MKNKYKHLDKILDKSIEDKDTIQPKDVSGKLLNIGDSVIYGYKNNDINIGKITRIGKRILSIDKDGINRNLNQVYKIDK